MKQLFSLALAILMVFSTAVVASAESTTTLTTTVPAASYTLNVPATQEIPYNAEKVALAVPTVSDASGFAEGKNLRVNFSYGALSSPNVNTTIPYTITYETSPNQIYSFSDNVLVFRGESDGGVSDAYPGQSNGLAIITNGDIYHLYINIKGSDWGKALGGDYTSIITYTAEVVAP